MLKQMFKLGSLVAICGTLLFTGCEQMDADIALSEDFNPTEKLAFGVAGHQGAGPMGLGRGEKGGPGFGKCFDIVFPVTVIYPDKTTKEVASKEAYMTLIKSWKEANPESKFIRRFPTSSEIAIQTDPEESKEDFYIEMQRANEADEARDILDELADILDEPADIFSTTSVKEKAKAIQGKNPKPVAPTTERGTKGLGLSDHKNKFYEFIASKDAKNMAKTAALGLITTVLTILASQATSNKKITASTAMEIQPRQIDTDLSYYGIPN
jgi:hypothetical protein